mmetsp:Transcript_20742/g.28000  ORF Transcript_20742/g.28000 Transcript_20742/m.28000 type:complete len:154 (+) Transcript_20742:341-802(+)
MHDGKYYRYRIDSTKGENDTYEDISGLVHFINRLQHPLVVLNTEESIARFLDESKEVEETTGFLKKGPIALGSHHTKLKFKTRVLVFMFDKSEYEAEMRMIREAGRVNAQRLSVRMGLVEDPKLIRLYKARYGNKWFNDEVQLSSLVVQRFDK